MDLSERAAPGAARHPWERARFRLFVDLLTQAGVWPGATRVLDAGSGDAWFAEQLLASGCGRGLTVTCWDTGYTAAVIASLDLDQAPSLRLVSERPTATFDVILALDVLEHVKDDQVLLQTLVNENLAAGGHMFISVPAWPNLVTAHDRRMGHFRRYSAASLRRKILESGLVFRNGGGAFHCLLLARIAEALREQWSAAPDPSASPMAWAQPDWVTHAVDAVLRLDGWLTSAFARQTIAFPGLSLWALCQKP